MNYYRFTPAKRIDAKTTRMATVEVFEVKGKRIKSIGKYAFTRFKPWQSEIEQMVYELIREYYTRKIFARTK